MIENVANYAGEWITYSANLICERSYNLCSVDIDLLMKNSNNRKRFVQTKQIRNSGEYMYIYNSFEFVLNINCSAKKLINNIFFKKTSSFNLFVIPEKS